MTALTIAPVRDLLLDPSGFEHAQRVAKVFASAELVPGHLRGKVADCLIALAIAHRMGEDPLTVMQNIYFVSGRPGWKTEYMIARANRSGVFRGRIRWRTEGAGAAMRVTALATLADTGEEVSATADMRMAEAEGWTKNPKYRSMPEHMLRWRAATFLIRLHAPEVMFGLATVDEAEDLVAAQAAARPVEVPAVALDDGPPPPIVMPVGSRLDALETAVAAGDTAEDASQDTPSLAAASSAAAASPADGVPAPSPSRGADDEEAGEALPLSRPWEAMPAGAVKTRLVAFLGALERAGSEAEYWEAIKRGADVMISVKRAYPGLVADISAYQAALLKRWRAAGQGDGASP